MELFRGVVAGDSATGTTAQVNSTDAAPQPDGNTWRALTTRNAQRLFPRLNEIS
jgi:hypothetical protein